MKTLRQLANQIVSSERSLKKQNEKNFKVWVTAYVESTLLENSHKEFHTTLVELGIAVRTVENRLGMFRTAFKNGLKLDQFTAFSQVEIANKKIKNSEAKSVKGQLVDIPDSGNAEAQKDAEIVKAQNENELVAILASAEFKKFKAEFVKQSWSFANIKKALEQK